MQQDTSCNKFKSWYNKHLEAVFNEPHSCLFYNWLLKSRSWTLCHREFKLRAKSSDWDHNSNERLDHDWFSTALFQTGTLLYLAWTSPEHFLYDLGFTTSQVSSSLVLRSRYRCIRHIRTTNSNCEDNYLCFYGYGQGWFTSFIFLTGKPTKSIG